MLTAGASIKSLRMPTSFVENEEIVKDVKENLKKQAQDIITVNLPIKLKTMQQLSKDLETALLDVKSLSISSISDPTVSNDPDGSFNLKHRIDPKATPRKRKRPTLTTNPPDTSENEDDEEDAAEALAATPVPHPVLPKARSAVKTVKEENRESMMGVKFFDKAEVNGKIRDVMKLVRLELKDIVTLSSKVRGWVQSELPENNSAEDNEGDDSPLHDRLIKELASAESGALSILESHHKYHMARADLITKCLEYPNVMDLTEAVHALDELQATHLRVGIQDCFYTYVFLYDLLVKNMDEIATEQSLSRSTPRFKKGRAF
ncbi:proteasome activator pa28 [Chytridium lagenaria]|nr:proteasome activator pa28 [Chytridium lagenaria]